MVAGGLFSVFDPAGHRVIQDKGIASEKELVDLIGKEAAKRLMAATPTARDLNTFLVLGQSTSD